jgi:BASS family bile acid:Na+ symporter
MRHWRPLLADRLHSPANLISKVLNFVRVTLILIARFALLVEIQLRGLIGMSILWLASWAVGWFLGGTDPAIRKTTVLTTSMRNVGVGLVIAATAFAGTPVITATLAYGLFAIVGSLLLALPGPSGHRSRQVSPRRSPTRCDDEGRRASAQQELLD